MKMDSIKQSLQDLAQHFNTTMAEFQQNLSSSNPASSPTSNIAAQFCMFRTFVLTALENLQRQVEHLSLQQDRLEMSSRKKILLVHGVPEDKNEDVSALVTKTLSDRLKMPGLSVEDVSRCHRMGRPQTDKPRAILLKFKQLTLRNQVWFDKPKLKSSGITLSEFLTKERHDVFMAARQRFGVSKCWTKEGVIFVVGSDGKRIRIVTKSELDSVPGVSPAQGPATNTVSTAASTSSKPRPAPPTLANRAKRNIKK